jgi:hypothetical protein
MVSHEHVERHLTLVPKWWMPKNVSKCRSLYKGRVNLPTFENIRFRRIDVDRKTACKLSCLNSVRQTSSVNVALAHSQHLSLCLKASERKAELDSSEIPLETISIVVLSCN